MFGACGLRGVFVRLAFPLLGDLLNAKQRYTRQEKTGQSLLCALNLLFRGLGL